MMSIQLNSTLPTEEVGRVVELGEPLYWKMMVSAIICCYLVFKLFDSLSEKKKVDFLKVFGVLLLLTQFTILTLSALFAENGFALDHHLPLHFCSINYLFISLNCFLRNRMLFYATGYMGITGGLHAFLTPILTAGDSNMQIAFFVFSHSIIIIMPLIMIRHFNMKFRKFDWIKTVFIGIFVSTLMMGINALINIDPSAEANYMFVSDKPEVDNPFLLDLPLPYYIFPLYVVAGAHMIVINWIYKKAMGVQLER
ncbi:MAG: TIGR02206 family membrane protein [Crocinitomicaceae bacterium]|nr:TIGR02206 family membrane protein [Crocinitomicaceae bacterium]